MRVLKFESAARRSGEHLSSPNGCGQTPAARWVWVYTGNNEATISLIFLDFSGLENLNSKLHDLL